MLSRILFLAGCVRLDFATSFALARSRVSARVPLRTLARATASEVGVTPAPGAEIFCNRELKMGSVKAVGFDMDHTLIVYSKEFDLLTFDLSIAKLVEK